MSSAALALAIVGVALSILALAWQAATFILTGPRVTARLVEGIRGRDGGVLAGPPSLYTAEGHKMLAAKGYAERVLALDVINTGRMAATVRGWSLGFAQGAVYTLPSDPRNPPLPSRVEGASSSTWYVPLDDLVALQAQFVDQSADAALVVGVVDLANGKRIESRNALRMKGRGDRDVVGRLALALARRRLKRRG